MKQSQGLTWVAGDSTPTKTWITRVFNFGTWEEWQMLKEKVEPETITEALQQPLKGQWTRHGKAFAETMFDCHLSDDVLISYNV